MLRFLYATDLHGDEVKFEVVLEKAIEWKINLIHLGADILPKGRGSLHNIQRNFLNGFLKDYHKRCNDRSIELLLSFGNDDLHAFKPLYRKYGKLLDEHPYQYENFIFQAYNYVPIYPFSLRTACKNDSKGWVYNDRPCDTMEADEHGFYKVDDPDAYFEAKGTIQYDLEKIKGGDNKIFACHCPPSGVKLDACTDGRHVGSQALFDWIMKNQPKLVLCGHIHESYRKTNQYKATIGGTTVLQPGQGLFGVTMVDIKISDTVETELLVV